MEMQTEIQISHCTSTKITKVKKKDNTECCQKS